MWARTPVECALTDGLRGHLRADTCRTQPEIVARSTCETHSAACLLEFTPVDTHSRLSCPTEKKMTKEEKKAAAEAKRAELAAKKAAKKGEAAPAAAADGAEDDDIEGKKPTKKVRARTSSSSGVLAALDSLRQPPIACRRPRRRPSRRGRRARRRWRR